MKPSTDACAVHALLKFIYSAFSNRHNYSDMFRVQKDSQLLHSTVLDYNEGNYSIALPSA
jgi:hypothetical protein